MNQLTKQSESLAQRQMQLREKNKLGLARNADDKDDPIGCGLEKLRGAVMKIQLESFGRPMTKEELAGVKKIARQASWMRLLGIVISGQNEQAVVKACTETLNRTGDPPQREQKPKPKCVDPDALRRRLLARTEQTEHPAE